jgi:cyanophycinase
MIAKAGGGDFVVLRATGADGYNTYLYDMGGLDSVETLVVKTREAAADPFVLDRVNKAEAIFIAGGDQKDYVTLWKGTPLEAAINARMAAKVPIGGTSAGLAVLGGFDFTALNGTIDSATALANPYDRRVTLDRGFLTAVGLANTITDSHFVERDRMGRLVTFLARILKDGWATWADARAIGIDSTAALLVEGGTATLVGGGAAYFLRPTIEPAICQPKKPLTFRNVEVIKLLPDASFRLDNWSGGQPATYPSVETGVFAPPY